ncbi:hypothetical protein [Sphingomonas immobilis]|uniref:Uncharacterized protein n=1 Tax=Sphingomonas immobilis TaxID=3063997 RepID=A0ABT8ZVF4_9SPHN|nr:hypothetical protein [Sphingomonas sp. CA1-15]MDO7841539.1 hypothetical protein [Sphingomonas sp. CA1-15]
MTPAARRIVAILLAVAELVAMLLALFLAAMSVMMFDAPGSELKPELWRAFYATWALPAALFVGSGFAVAAAIRFTRFRILAALLIPAAAFLWLVVAMASL